MGDCRVCDVGNCVCVAGVAGVGIDLCAVDDRAPGNDEGRDEVLLERYSLAAGGQSGECSGVDRARSRPCSLSS